MRGFRLILFTAILITTSIKEVDAQIVGGESQTNGNTPNNLVTAVPFLLITPDARTGAMGNAGVATKGDVNSASLNPAKLSMLENKYAIGLTYSPWLTNIASDINLSYLSGYYRLSERNTIAASLRYFSLGSVNLTNENQQIIGISNPNEFAIDVSFSRKFGEKFSIGSSARYISSNLLSGVPGSSGSNSANSAVSMDIGAIYSNEVFLFGRYSIISTGISISNLGTKIAPSDLGPKLFLPANLKIGGAATINIDEYNALTFALDLNKLLIPTQPIFDQNGNIIEGKDPNRSVTSAIFSSFSDAPGGFNEELKEVGISTGIEYNYNNVFAIRAGYNYENKDKGDSSYLTVGAGARYNNFDLNISYIVADTNKSPLANTLRFGLIYNFLK